MEQATQNLLTMVKKAITDYEADKIGVVRLHNTIAELTGLMIWEQAHKAGLINVS